MGVAIVVGGTKGIGKGIALELAKQGMKVIIVARTEADLQAMKEYMPENIFTIRGDIGNKDERKNIFKEIDNYLKDQKLKYMVFAAATEGPSKSFLDATEDEFEYTVAVNFFAPASFIRNLINNKKFEDNARILLLSSGLDHIPMEGMSAYGPSKAAVKSLWENLNLEFKNKVNIYIGISNPGIVKTGMQRRLRESTTHPNAQQFQQFHDQSKLVLKQISAEYHCSLLRMDEKKFKEIYWDFDDPEIRTAWLKEVNIAEDAIYYTAKQNNTN